MSTSRLFDLRIAAIVGLVLSVGVFAYGIGREPSVGAIKGQLTALESGEPLKGSLYLHSTREINGEYVYHQVDSKADGSFLLRNIEAGEYSFSAYGSWHSLRDGILIVEEGKTLTWDIDLEPDAHGLSIDVHQRVFVPGENLRITCSGFVDEDNFNVELYKVDSAAFLTNHSGSIQSLLEISSYWEESRGSSTDLASNPALSLYSAKKLAIKPEPSGGFIQRVKLPPPPPGLYVVAAKSGELQSFDWLMITSIGMVTKTAPGQSLVYVVDLKSGKPIQSAQVSQYIGSRQIASGKTDSSGMASFATPTYDEENSKTVSVARYGESFAFASSWLSSMPDSDNLVYAYTDRPVYRPGQNVFYKGIIRARNNENYKTPSGENITVEVYDSNDTLIHRSVQKSDKFGGFSGSLDLTTEAPTGTYFIRAGTGARAGGEPVAHFTVASYRKPEYSVKITFDKRRYIRGEMVTARVSANYYFGAPVANAKVSYHIFRSPFWLFEAEREYSVDPEQYWRGDGVLADNGETRTDANGEAIIRFRANWKEPKERYYWNNDQEFQVSVNVVDKGDSWASGVRRVAVTRGAFALSINTDSDVVKPHSKVKITVTVQDYDRRPIKNQFVDVALARQTWDKQSGMETKTLQKRRVKTNARGEASLQLPVDAAGSLLISATTKDARRNRVSSETYLYSCSDDLAGCNFYSSADLKIVTDKRSYSPGETAKALIMTSKSDSDVWVTLEGSRVHESRLIHIKGTSAQVEFAVKDAYKPNFFISACFVRDKKLIHTEQSVKLSLKSESLRVAIKTDKREYKPGEKVSYKLKVTDSKGKPAVAALSLGVVDEAIYAVEPDRTVPILDFFYEKRWNKVSTSFSFPEIYFGDPDKGGSAREDMPAKIRTRKRFLDTAYWNPYIVTNQNGEADVNFNLPDNLTTWRATARAITTQTQCGQAINTMICKQDMLVRLEMPRFLVEGDKACLIAMVHNYTGKDQHVRVKLKAPGLRVKDRLERIVSVSDHKSARIEWTVIAEKVGSSVILVEAAGSGAGDAVELVLPIRPRCEQVTTATQGAIGGGGERPITISIKQGAIPESTSLRVNLAPSLVAAMLGSLDYLAGYPYGCTEQTVSKFLPDVVLYRSLKSFGITDSKLAEELPGMVRKGLDRLYNMQLPDGGWGWSEYGKPDPWMTAYVIYALLNARDAGFIVKPEVIDSGNTWLKQAIGSGKLRIYPKAFAAYVLALSGVDSSATMNQIAARRQINNEALASLALGFYQLGHYDRAREMLDRLFDQAIVSGDIHWKGVSRWDGGDIEATALALQALLKNNPSDERAHDIVRWLMDQRTGYYWMSTRGTAMSIYALSEFVTMTKELSPDFEAVVSLNGRVIDKVWFGPDSIVNPQKEITIRGSLLRTGHNKLLITKSGQGALYYSTNLTQCVAKKSLAPLRAAGVSIERNYYKSAPGQLNTTAAWQLGSPISGCKPGDVVTVRLTIRATEPMSHLLVEDFIPAGFEIIDRGDMYYDEWSYWWVGRDIRDDKISFYLDNFGRGARVITYPIRAGFSGVFCALPAQIFSMYDPSIRATTGERQFVIR